MIFLLDRINFYIYICFCLKRWSHRLMVRTPPFHGGNMGSNPVGITNKKSSLYGSFFYWLFLTELKTPLGSDRSAAKIGVYEELCDELANPVVVTCCEYHQYKQRCFVLSIFD